MSATAIRAGKTAVVTGASRGIGRSVALALARVGAGVAITARTPGPLQAVADELAGCGGRSLALPCDVTDADQVQRLADQVKERFGTADILVNSVGAGTSHKFLAHPDELWQQMLAVNLTSTYYVTKAFVAGMCERRWGRIINVASTAAQTGGRYIAAYTAAKHGVLGLTRALATELVAYDITVNAVCPGYVDTPMTDDTIRNITARTGKSAADARAMLEKMNPQQRLIQPDEVAAAVLFLAQDSSRGITGQAITIDGGASVA